MGHNERRGQKQVADPEFEGQLAKLARYINATARHLEWRSTLYDVDDLSQEAAIVLWRVLTEYPSASKDETVKLFKTSLVHKLASIFRKKRFKLELRQKRLEESGESTDDFDTGWHSGEVLPWDFFKRRLEAIAQRLDKERYVRLLFVSSRINDKYLKLKEDALKEIL